MLQSKIAQFVIKRRRGWNFTKDGSSGNDLELLKLGGSSRLLMNFTDAIRPKWRGEKSEFQRVVE